MGKLRLQIPDGQKIMTHLGLQSSGEIFFCCNIYLRALRVFRSGDTDGTRPLRFVTY
jgi:hypothetical protein